MDKNRTIETVLDLETGELTEAAVFLDSAQTDEADIFKLRTLIEKQIQLHEVNYVCIYCKQAIAIRGRTNFIESSKTYYFTHLVNSKDCVIKTNNILTREEVQRIKYNGAKESALHENLKNLIAHFLRLEPAIKEVLVEKVYRELAISKEWKKPDVMAIFKDKKIAFELQLSTTFLSVIVQRTLFYQSRNVFLIWVFPHFSLQSDLQKFTQKDVYFNNSFNVYVFDKEAQEQSATEQGLVISCFYHEFTLEENVVSGKWVKKFIRLSDITFDHEKVTNYFYDSDAQRDLLKLKLEALQKSKEDARRLTNIKQKVKSCLDYLRKFYKNDYDPAYYSGYNPFDSLTEPDEILALNEEVKFSTEKSSVIYELFLTGNKWVFLKYICGEDKVRKDFSQVSIRGKTIFELIVERPDYNSFFGHITLLFRMGYVLTDADYATHQKLYDDFNFNTSEVEKEKIERWAYVTCLNSLWSKDTATELEDIRKVLFAIMSLKHGLIIGSKFTVARQVTMNFIEFHPEYGHFYLRAMKAYGQYDAQLNDDKSGKLRSKILTFKEKNPPQKPVLLLYEIFSEV